MKTVMLSLLHVQIIIDLAVFITILFLLRRLDKNISKNCSTVDAALISEFKEILADSHDSTNHFLEAVEEKRKVLGKLFLQLDDKEKKLTILAREAETFIKKLDETKTASESLSPENRYADVLQMLKGGLSREEVSKQSGFTESEVNLIVDLAKVRAGFVS